MGLEIGFFERLALKRKVRLYNQTSLYVLGQIKECYNFSLPEKHAFIGYMNAYFFKVRESGTAYTLLSIIYDNQVDEIINLPSKDKADIGDLAHLISSHMTSKDWSSEDRQKELVKNIQGICRNWAGRKQKG